MSDLEAKKALFLNNLKHVRSDLYHRELDLMDYLEGWPQGLRDLAGRMCDANRDFLDAMEACVRLVGEMEPDEPLDDGDEDPTEGEDVA